MSTRISELLLNKSVVCARVNNINRSHNLDSSVSEKLQQYTDMKDELKGL
jgi:hypothetical protein